MQVKSLSLDLLLTPDHRFCYSSEWDFYKKNNNWRIAPVRELMNKYLIVPRACKWLGKNHEEFRIGKHKINFTTFVKFFGIWVSEGCTTGTGKRKFVVVSQSVQSKYTPEIKALFDELKVKYIQCKSGSCVQFRIEDPYFYNYFKKFGKSEDKYIPRIIKNSSAKLLRLFLDWYIKGDGHIKKNKAIHFVSKSEKLIDDLQEVCIKLGVGCTKQDNKRFFRMETHKTKSGEDKWY